jgi:hypothetical protein
MKALILGIASCLTVFLLASTEKPILESKTMGLLTFCFIEFCICACLIAFPPTSRTHWLTGGFWSLFAITTTCIFFWLAKSKNRFLVANQWSNTVFSLGLFWNFLAAASVCLWVITAIMAPQQEWLSQRHTSPRRARKIK